MEMTTYQAVFAVLLIFFVGDLVGALTKAKISSMFVIMMGFLVLFMTGIYPANIMEVSGFAGVASLGQYFLLFNMGTSVDIATLKKEWRTVLCAVVGMAAAILGCAVVIPLVGKDFALAAAPVVNGGIVATTTMVDACNSLGLDTAAAGHLHLCRAEVRGHPARLQLRPGRGQRPGGRPAGQARRRPQLQLVCRAGCLCGR